MLTDGLEMGWLPMGTDLNSEIWLIKKSNQVPVYAVDASTIPGVVLVLPDEANDALV
jgi:hypothetical protein